MAESESKAAEEILATEDNLGSGYIKLYRSVRDHYLFKEKVPYSKFEAWCDILLKVNFSDNKVMIKGVVFEVKRGQTLRSLDSWADAWRWDKSKVRRFLDLLQLEHMVCIFNEKITTRLTVCNFDFYQRDQHNSDTVTTRRRHNSDTVTTPNNKDKNDKNDKNNLSKGDTVVGLPSSTQPPGDISYEKRCLLFIEKFNSVKVLNGKPSKYQVTAAVREKLKVRLKTYTPNQILEALKLALKDKHHIENNFVYITPEFILREAILERYLNSAGDPVNKEEIYTQPTKTINHQEYEKK